MVIKRIQKAEFSTMNTTKGARNAKLAPKQDKNIKMV
jgi:hypothetical protein